MLVGLTYASIKDTQGVIWKCITWPKTFGKGMQICMHRIKLSLSLDWGLKTKHTCENKGNKKFWLLFFLFCGLEHTCMHLWFTSVDYFVYVVDYKIESQVLLFQDVCFDISKQRCIVLQTIYDITKSCTICKNLGYMWSRGESFVPNCHWFCFELKLWTLVACGCIVIYHTNLLKHLGRVRIPNCSWQPC
jgi:hypothetical protein